MVFSSIRKKLEYMRIIHFSDFHLRADHIDRAESIVNRLKTALVAIQKERKIDLIIFTGDMIDKAGKDFSEPKISTALAAFEQMVIKPLTEALGLSANRFIFTMGNHEVDRSRTTLADDEKLTESLKKHEDVDWHIHNNGDKEYRIEEYNAFRDVYWNANKGDVDVKMTRYQYGVKLEIDGVKVGINCLNTSWRCFDSDTDEHKIVTGKSQITDNRDFFEDCNIRFAIGHHHPVKMSEFEITTLNDLIAQNYDAYFCGHTHNNDGEYITRAKGSAFYFTAPGTLSVNESAEGKYRNGFMVIDFEQSLRYVDAQCYFQDENTDFVRDNNYGGQGIWHQAIPGSSIIKPIDVSLLCQKKEGEFIRNEKIDEIFRSLQDASISTIQLVALTGLGKTRILREAFDDGRQHTNCFYCEYSDNSTGLLYDIDEIISKHRGEDGLIILDNCPNDILEQAVDKRNKYASRFRVIGVNNEYYDRNNLTIRDCVQIPLDQDDMRTTVNEYIERNIPANNGDNSAQEQIKKIADGFPGMAVELVTEYHKEQNVDVHTVDHVVKKMLKFEPGKENDQETALRSMALFQPCPYRDEYKEAFRFIREDENITPLFGKSNEEKRRLFAQTINHYDGSLIETTQSWLNVRPFPLAIWLVGKWFEAGVDEECMENIVQHIEALDKPLYTVIKDGLYKRLEYMQDSVPAQDLIVRLTADENAPFCSEKVVCSDLGSRLFLAMSSVNPGAIASCLRRVLLPHGVEWAKENVTGAVRRNLVWALEKLCFRKESYHDGSKVIALLAAAENETWGNNATGQLKQLFHVMLPGTQATLHERVETLQYLKGSGAEYVSIALDCFDRAFDNGSFVRDGAGSKFGLKREMDYMPKSNREIVEYWEQCRDMLIGWLDENAEVKERIAQMANGHVLRWAYDGMLVRIFPLLEKLAIIKNWEWEEMYTSLKKVSPKRLQVYPKEFLQQLEAFMQRLRPTLFCQKLKDARMAVYDRYDLEIKEQMEFEQQMFRPLAKEFLEEKIYLSTAEAKAIATDKEYHDIWFTLALDEIITDEQLEGLLNTLQVVVEECGGEGFKSSFVSRVCYVFRERPVLRTFLERLYAAGYRELYVRLMANSETEDFTSYDEIKCKIGDGRLGEEAAADYLDYVSLITKKHLQELIKRYFVDYPDKTAELMAYISIHRFDKDVLKDKDTYDTVKQVVHAYPIKEDMGRANYEYAQYVKFMLEDYHDEDFAVAINRKLIDGLNKGYFHKDFDGIYSELMKSYRNAIWEDFEQALVSDDHYAFIFQVSDELGSGSGFGAGVLFQVEDEKIKETCRKYPDKAYRVAQMIPIFKDENSFSDWLIWMIDNYGDHKEVLDSLHANMGTFSWGGSVVPLLEHKKRCFEHIREHKRPEVRKWTENCLQELEDELKRERNREEYMRLHYD